MAKIHSREMQTLIEGATTVISPLQIENPYDERLRYVQTELQRLTLLLQQQWPLPKEQAETFHLGLFALREIEGEYDELVPLIYQIDEALHIERSDIVL